MFSPEAITRQQIDAQLSAAGWAVVPSGSAIGQDPVALCESTGDTERALPFVREEPSEKPWTKDLWIYDLRTNQHFTLKTNPLKEADLVDFVQCYGVKKAGCKPALPNQKETDRFKKFTYDEIVARDKANLDIFWLKDESLEDTENLPHPEELAAKIVESPEATLEEFSGVEQALVATPE